jgi:hypothetical protein
MGFLNVFLRRIDGRVLIEGVAPSFQAKRQIEAETCARLDAPVSNRLRVAPGRG